MSPLARGESEAITALTEYQMSQKPEFTKKVLRVPQNLRAEIHCNEVDAFKFSALKNKLTFNLRTINSINTTQGHTSVDDCPAGYLVGCVHLGTDGVHGCPLLLTAGFLLLCSVGFPLDAGRW